MGELVIYEGDIYQCKAAVVTPGDFDLDTNWNKIILQDYLTNSMQEKLSAGVHIPTGVILDSGVVFGSGFVLSDGVEAVTQSANDNSNKVATTAYTDNAISSAISSMPQSIQFIGTVGTGGTIEWADLPTPAPANNGWTYSAISANNTPPAPICLAGDLLISNGSDWVVIPSGDEPSGTVTNVATGTGLTGGPITGSGTISLDTSGVAAGTYNSVTVDTYGRVTAGTVENYASGTVTSISAGTGLAVSGGGPITTTGSLSLATSGVTAGSYGQSSNKTLDFTNNKSFTIPYITVDTYGRVTAVQDITITTQDKPTSVATAQVAESCSGNSATATSATKVSSSAASTSYGNCYLTGVKSANNELKFDTNIYFDPNLHIVHGAA